MKPVRTWILVADGSRARILENLGPGRGISQIPGMTFDHEMPGHYPGGGERGRSFESASPTRHAIETASDPIRLSKRNFARDLTTLLRERLGSKAFDRLVVAAPPQMMGEIRAEMDEQVRAVVSGEVVADLTRLDDREIARHVGTVLAT